MVNGDWGMLNGESETVRILHSAFPILQLFPFERTFAPRIDKCDGQDS